MAHYTRDPSVESNFSFLSGMDIFDTMPRGLGMSEEDMWGEPARSQPAPERDPEPEPEQDREPELAPEPADVPVDDEDEPMFLAYLPPQLIDATALESDDEEEIVCTGSTPATVKDEDDGDNDNDDNDDDNEDNDDGNDCHNEEDHHEPEEGAPHDCEDSDDSGYQDSKGSPDPDGEGSHTADLEDATEVTGPIRGETHEADAPHGEGAPGQALFLPSRSPSLSPLPASGPRDSSAAATPSKSGVGLAQRYLTPAAASSSQPQLTPVTKAEDPDWVPPPAAFDHRKSDWFYGKQPNATAEDRPSTPTPRASATSRPPASTRPAPPRPIPAAYIAGSPTNSATRIATPEATPASATQRAPLGHGVGAQPAATSAPAQPPQAAPAPRTPPRPVPRPAKAYLPRRKRRWYLPSDSEEEAEDGSHSRAAAVETFSHRFARKRRRLGLGGGLTHDAATAGPYKRDPLFPYVVVEPPQRFDRFIPYVPVKGSGGTGAASTVLTREVRARILHVLLGNAQDTADPLAHISLLYPHLNSASAIAAAAGDLDVDAVMAEAAGFQLYAAGALLDKKGVDWELALDWEPALDWEVQARIINLLLGTYGPQPPRAPHLAHLTTLWPVVDSWAAATHYVGADPVDRERVRAAASWLRAQAGERVKRGERIG